MPRKFTEDEEAIIRQGLLREAADHFGRAGLSKTSVEELTRAVGISKGAFYRFFESKEDLYFALIHQYEEEVRNEIRRIFADAAPDQTQAQLLARVLKESLAGVARQPFLRSLLTGDEASLLWRGGSDESRRHSVSSDIAFVDELLTETTVDRAVASGMLRSLFFLIPHRGEIGEDVFDQVLESLVDAVVVAIVPRSGEHP